MNGNKEILNSIELNVLKIGGCFWRIITSYWATVKPVNSNPANEDILWNKDTSSGPKLLFSVQIALWNEDNSELGTLMARPK
jgi:hypothetical protein